MRIIAGRLKGRRLRSPEGRATRPPLDRVKEAIFDALPADLLDRPVLDLFGGVGSFALEALSRGASRTVICERAEPAREVLAHNVATCGVRSRTTVSDADLLDGLPAEAREGGPYGVAFCDPPYAFLEGDERPEVEALLAEAAGVLDPDGILVLHGPPDVDPPQAEDLETIREKTYGRSTVWFYGRVGSEG